PTAPVRCPCGDRRSARSTPRTAPSRSAFPTSSNISRPYKNEDTHPSTRARRASSRSSPADRRRRRLRADRADRTADAGKTHARPTHPRRVDDERLRVAAEGDAGASTDNAKPAVERADDRRTAAVRERLYQSAGGSFRSRGAA